jgi:predicted MFS family arabinose efflux permease
MLAPYRRALALPGAWQFSVTGLIARLPIAMVALAVVLLVSSATGSYAVAGAMSAVFTLAAAAGSLVTSRWMDRYGQARLLAVLATANAVLLVALALAIVQETPRLIWFGIAALAGLTQPAVGSMVRARWASVAPDAERLRSAFALESVIDELIFSIGPLITATLAYQVALPAPLIAAGVIGIVGGLLLAVQRGTEPRPSARHAEHHQRSAIRHEGMLLVVCAALGIGGVFGSYEVIVVAFTRQQGHAGSSGLVLGLWALGSMIGGIVFGARHLRTPLPRQLAVLSLILTLVLLPAPFLHSIPVLTVVTFIGGAAVAPVLIAAFSLTERLVPGSLLTEGLSWTNSGLALGFAAGATAAGWLVDAAGTSWAFALPIASAFLAFAFAAGGQARLLHASDHESSGALAAAWNTEPIPGPAPGGVTDDPGTR